MASVSATTFKLKAKLYKEWWAFGMWLFEMDSELRWCIVMHAVLFIHFWNVNLDHIKFILPVICSYCQLW